MPLIGETGDLHETHGEKHVEWRIPNIFSLPEEVNSYYESPVFYFADTCWCLSIYPNGETRHMTSEWIGLYLIRKNSGFARVKSIGFGIMTGDEGIDWLSIENMEIQVIGSVKFGQGLTKFILKSDLLERKSSLMPSDVLTVICKLKSDVSYSAETSLFTRLWNVSRDMKTILEKENNTDVTFKLQGSEKRAHSLILERRSHGYFAGLFSHTFQENATGEVEIKGIEEGVFKCVLFYVYSGEAKGLSGQNIFKVYVAADRFLLKELKKLCTEYMKEYMCSDLVCDVIAIADKYEEGELREYAMKYFTDNAEEVMETDQWTKFKEENVAVAFKILENIALKTQKHKRQKI